MVKPYNPKTTWWFKKEILTHLSSPYRMESLKDKNLLFVVDKPIISAQGDILID